MNKTIRGTLRLSAATLAALGLVAGALWWGVYDVGADAPHTRPVYAVLELARERSVAMRAMQLSVPALDDEARIRNGAGNYQAMCAGCHLAPGMAPTELSRGLYPAPPNLSARQVDAAAAFWTIKHGIKASGMPAWGASMGDEHIWDLVAFLGRLPALDAAQYRDLVARSGGHSHGGGETGDDDRHATMPSDAPGQPPHPHGEHDAPAQPAADHGHEAAPPPGAEPAESPRNREHGHAHGH
ncbi:c-type cytochrome [Lysobacter gummosus]|jgi:mono/diheme cytochrome c family protein